MVSKDRKRREKKRDAKRKSDNISISSMESVPEKRLNVESNEHSI